MTNKAALEKLAELQKHAQFAISIAEDFAREHDLDYKLQLCEARYMKITEPYQLDYVGGKLGDWAWTTSSTFC